jgi:hypothetical protein
LQILVNSKQDSANELEGKNRNLVEQVESLQEELEVQKSLVKEQESEKLRINESFERDRQKLFAEINAAQTVLTQANSDWAKEREKMVHELEAYKSVSKSSNDRLEKTLELLAKKIETPVTQPVAVPVPISSAHLTEQEEKLSKKVETSGNQKTRERRKKKTNSEIQNLQNEAPQADTIEPASKLDPDPKEKQGDTNDGEETNLKQDAALTNKRSKSNPKASKKAKLSPDKENTNPERKFKGLSLFKDKMALGSSGEAAQPKLPQQYLDKRRMELLND